MSKSFSKCACVSGYFIKICSNVNYIQEINQKDERCTDNLPYDWGSLLGQDISNLIKILLGLIFKEPQIFYHLKI